MKSASRIIVTGGSGFIGSNLVNELLTRNQMDSIVNVDCLSYGSSRPATRMLSTFPNYKFLQSNINNTEKLKRTVRDADFILNLAAETHVDRSIANPTLFFRSNCRGVLNLLELTRKENDEATFVQVGTDEVYGDIEERPSLETDPVRPSSPYSATKAAADLLVLSYHRTYGLKTLVTRCSNNFGPYQSPEKLIPKTVIRSILGLDVPIYGAGKNVRDWIYVADHCEALMLVMKKGKAGEIYNISTGEGLGNLELVGKVLTLLGKNRTSIKHVEDRPGHDKRYALDSRKIRLELGWAPKYAFDDALRLTVNWYKENESWWRSLIKNDLLNSTPWKRSWRPR